MMGPPDPMQAMGPPNPAEAAMPAGMEGITPEMIDQMVALGTLTEEQAMLLRQRTRAEGLADSQMPGGINTRAGFVADNPLSAMGTMLRQYKGNDDLKGIDKREAGIMGEMKGGRSLLGQMLRGALMTPETDPLAGRAAAAKEYEPPADTQLVQGGGGLLEPTAPTAPQGPPAPGPLQSSLRTIENPMAGKPFNMSPRNMEPGAIDFNKRRTLMDILRGALPGGGM